MSGAVMRQYELVERVKSYDPYADEDALNRAYIFAMKMHQAQKRESGEPYFSHPVAVAGILTELRLDDATIMAALLHDTAEDTAASFTDLKELFGADVANLVRGVSKLSKVPIRSEAAKKEEQAENFQKLVLAMSADIRVLLIKLADRLHNMRTLHFCANPEKRMRIATETMEIYVPLAERIGMHAIKDELEDISFQILHPEAYETISARLEFLTQKNQKEVDRVIEALQADLAESGLQASITGRKKRPYSIWRKMQEKNVAFEQIFDVMAFRVVVAGVEECYQALGIIHTRYSMIPGRYKDYISTPKPNGYQSIHTGVMGPHNHKIEIQIRTADMHRIAEVGVAAHWEYKQGVHKEGKQYRWMRELLDLLQHSADPKEFLEHTKIAMHQNQVFCFSPKGDLISLPQGATAIDFAYAVHSKVGDMCVGVKINGKICPLRTLLQNGDQVEVLTAKNQTPSPEWERIAVTAKAKASIRRFLRAQHYQQLLDKGRAAFSDAMKRAEIAWTDKDLEPLVAQYKKQSPSDVFVMIAEGLLSVDEVMNKLFPQHKLSLLQKAKAVFSKKKTGAKKHPAGGPGKTMMISGLFPGMAYGFAKCCHPVFGDKIVGIVMSGRRVTIHTGDCPVIRQFRDEPERWIDVAWSDAVPPDETLPVRIKVVLADKPNALSELMTALAAKDVVVSHFSTTDRQGGWADVVLDIQIKSGMQLDGIFQALRLCPPVSSVERMKAG
ncbi:MAG: bifunctional (p)ppGpp synthetase/guanosine-3',5'-bis(diphosphate) 3'-pyrophosphohydrolase [Alphaproteobacteria bacterium]|nr:bifunctional (p)ppGpp synthetase/guanosine-3',5'-bis(diphosphate) 3'-pyrophosphohydrolase [Alphaproteobacteria bacterium]